MGKRGSAEEEEEEEEEEVGEAGEHCGGDGRREWSWELRERE